MNISFSKLWFIFFLFFNQVVWGQSKEIMEQNRYIKEWQEVDSLVALRRPSTALELTQKIYDNAQKDQNVPQQIKAIIYLNKFQVELEEEGLKEAIIRMEDLMENIDFPANAILASFLAEFYQNYLAEFGWKIRNRTQLSQAEADQDIDTWSANRFYQQISALYRQSIANQEGLKEIPIQTFQDIITEELASEGLRPTLYDVLMHRAIDYFTNDRSYLNAPAERFIIDDQAAFWDASTFVNHDFEGDPEVSYRYQVLLFFQDLLSTHLEDENPAALIDADLKRLEFVYQYAVMEEKDAYYLAALQRIKEKFQGNPVLAEIDFAVAKVYEKQGRMYTPSYRDRYIEPNPTHKWGYKKAIEIAQNAIDQFPDSYGAKHCQELIRRISTQKLSLEVERVNLPHEPILAQIKFANLGQVYFKVVKLKPSDLDDFTWNSSRREVIKSLVKAKGYRLGKVNLPITQDYHQHATEIKIDPLELGMYAIIISDQSDFSKKDAHLDYLLTQVSNIGYLSRKSGDQNSYVLMHRKDGSPLSDVKATFFDVQYQRNGGRKKRKIGDAMSDQNGFLDAKKFNQTQKNIYVQFEKGDDKFYLGDWVYFYFRGDPTPPKPEVTFFLDRGIYRPGQTIYFKGLVMQRDLEKQPKILTNQPVEITFFDANYQEVSSLDLVTNEFGTVSGEFIAPKTGLTGRMSIGTNLNGGRKFFRVEEYKRPQFEVQLDDFTEVYALEDTILMKGNALAFSGVELSGASVKYNITRRAQIRWSDYYNNYSRRPINRSAVTIANGNTQTDSKGAFQFNFNAVPDYEADPNTIYIFTINVDVTDITGETHSALKRIRLSNIGLVASVEVPEFVNQGDSLEIAASITNLANQPVPIKCLVKIQQLNTDDLGTVDRYWEMPDILSLTKSEYSKAFSQYSYGTEDRFFLPIQEVLYENILNSESGTWKIPTSSAWSNGLYQITLMTRDSQDNEIKVIKYFSIYNKALAEVPSNIPFIQQQNQSVYDVGDRLQIDLISSLEKQPYLIEIARDRELLNRSWITADQQITHSYSIKPTDKGGIYYLISYIKDNRAFSREFPVMIPWDEKELDIKLASFRENMEPGSEEKWQIKISGSKKEKVAAELVATMYDASLDALGSNNWYFKPFLNNSLSGLQWSMHYFESTNTNLEIFVDRIFDLPRRQYHNLNWFGFFNYTLFNDFEQYDLSPYRARNSDLLMDQSVVTEEVMAPAEPGMVSSALKKESSEVPPPPPPYSIGSGESNEDTIGGLSSKEENPSNNPEIRKNLKETVFFFPHLKTDESGDIILEFTMNEALTRWKFMALAHTKDLATAYLTQEVVTQKELMINPNPPRFLRVGDEIVFNGKISSLDKTTQTGTATLELFDALSMEKLDEAYQLTNKTIPFTLEEGDATTVGWTLKVPNRPSPILFRMVAQTEQFSDGEEQVLPVITNRQLVTESLPLSIRGNSKKTVKFDALAKASQSATLKHHQLTLEFSSNPAWYAVQALPYIMEYPYECTEQVFNRFYANALASHIVQQQPKIKAVFDQWKGTGALESNLMKNEELKTALLEETPWVLDAQSESKQKENIALLFDLNRMGEEQLQAFHKLSERQSASGGFPWFTGGRDSWYITQYLVEGFGHLEQLEIERVDFIPEMIHSAVQFLDNELKDHYQRLMERIDSKQAKWEDNHLRDIVIHYLYARSFYLEEVSMDEKTETAFQFFLGQADKYWTEASIYQQALIGLASHRLNKSELTEKVLVSLKERVIRNEELGAYWKYPNGYFWYQLPIETHVALTELFAEVGKDAELVEELKIWLLKNKQTQHWKTTKATAAAVFALLKYGSNWLDSDKPVKIDFKNQPKSVYAESIAEAQANSQPGTGYFKVDWAKEQVSQKFDEIKMKNPNKSIAWGGIYWQYFEDLDKIKIYKETPLKLDKKLFLSEYTENGPILTEIFEKQPLNQGDKMIVRIELRVDRDMEYIHMKDMRASGLEPLNVLSSYKWQGGLGYYESTKDLATHFFFDYLPKGTYVFEYPLWVNQKGEFSNGITTIQSMYAPEFTSHSEGIIVKVK